MAPHSGASINNAQLERIDKPAVAAPENAASRMESGKLLNNPNNGIQNQAEKRGLPSPQVVNSTFGDLALITGQKQTGQNAGARDNGSGTATREGIHQLNHPETLNRSDSRQVTNVPSSVDHRGNAATDTHLHSSTDHRGNAATDTHLHSSTDHRGNAATDTHLHSSTDHQRNAATDTYPHGSANHRTETLPSKLEPTRSTQGESAKASKLEPTRSIQGESAKASKLEPTRSTQGESAKASKLEPTRSTQGESAKASKLEPTRSIQGESAKASKLEPTRSTQGESAKASKLEPTKSTQGESPTSSKPEPGKPEVARSAEPTRSSQPAVAKEASIPAAKDAPAPAEGKGESRPQPAAKDAPAPAEGKGEIKSPPATITEGKGESKSPPATTTEGKGESKSPPATTTEGKGEIKSPPATTTEGKGESKSQPAAGNSRETQDEQAKLDGADKLGQQSKLASHDENDDDIKTLRDFHEEGLLASHHSEGVVARPADIVQQNFSNAGPAQQFDLARSNTATNAEAPISHSVQHNTFISGDRSHGVTRASFHGQEINNSNDPKSQSASDPNLTHSTSGHTGQTHSGTSHQTGTGHGATSSHGPGHDPSAHGHHSGHGSSHGTGHGQHQHGPGHGPNGHSKDPNGHDPSSGQGHDPTGQGHDPTGQGHDPTGQGIGTNGHDPNGQGNSPTGQGHDPNGQGHDPTGQGHDPSGQGTTLPGSGNNQPGGNGNGSGTGVDPILGQPLLGGGYGHIPYEGQPFPIYEERPIRNLVTLISEMGAAFGPLHNIWSPWGEAAIVLGQANPIAIHNPIYDNQTTNSGTINTQYQPLEPVSINNNPISIIDQPQILINTQVIGDVITGNSGQTIPNGPYSNPLSVIETSTGDSSIPTNSGSSSGINGGTNSGAQGNGTSTSSNTAANTNTPADTTASNAASNGQLTGQIAQDANTPASQFLNGSVDYWTNNLNPGNNSNMSVPNSPTPINDPVPVDNSPNTGQPNDMLPNHDQLVSGAEHHHGVKENANNIDQNQQKSRAELSDPWLQNDEQKHHAQILQDQKDAQQLEELKHRLELIANGMWQEPNKNGNGNKKPEVKESTNNSGRKTPARNDGLIGQIITLLNDVNKGKKPNANRTYVVKDGDTLESIAASVLLDVRLALLLYLINQPSLAKQIGVEWKQIKLPRGTVLYLPGEEEINTFRLAMPRGVGQGRIDVSSEGPVSQWQFDKQYLQGMDQRRRNVERLLGPLGSVNAKYDPETGRQCIAVRLGDTLRSIALKNPVLNDVSLWKLLAKSNNLPTEVDAKGAPIAILPRGMVLQLPCEEEIAAYRASQAALVRAHSPRKAIAAEVLTV